MTSALLKHEHDLSVVRPDVDDAFAAAVQRAVLVGKNVQNSVISSISKEQWALMDERDVNILVDAGDE